MIPQTAITESSHKVPWQTNKQVEQALVVCRILTEIFKDVFLTNHLAFCGRTSLRKRYLSPQLWYSEGIDLVLITTEPTKEPIDRIRDILSFLGNPVVNQKANYNTLVFRFESKLYR